MPRPLDGYPQPFGYSKGSVFPHLGPASYTQVVASAGVVPVTGGDTVQALEAGLKQFDDVRGGVTDDGCFSVSAIPITKSNPTGTASSALSGIPATTYRLKWTALVTATIGGQAQTAGNEAVAATNLSAECVRLFALGPK